MIVSFGDCGCAEDAFLVSAHTDQAAARNKHIANTAADSLVLFMKMNLRLHVRNLRDHTV
jgi:hypothetical protein